MKKFWTTKSGEKILAKDMKDSHIKNCWKMFGKYNCESRDFILKEANRRKLKLPDVGPMEFKGRYIERFQSVSIAGGLIVYDYGRPCYIDDGNGQEWSEDDDWQQGECWD